LDDVGYQRPGLRHVAAELRQLQRMTGEGAAVTRAARIVKIARSAAWAALRAED
jgi:hypothetical protein